MMVNDDELVFVEEALEKVGVGKAIPGVKPRLFSEPSLVYVGSVMWNTREEQ
jgi:hypothetical protein